MQLGEALGHSSISPYGFTEVPLHKYLGEPLSTTQLEFRLGFMFRILDLLLGGRGSLSEVQPDATRAFVHELWCLGLGFRVNPKPIDPKPTNPKP